MHSNRVSILLGVGRGHILAILPHPVIRLTPDFDKVILDFHLVRRRTARERLAVPLDKGVVQFGDADGGSWIVGILKDTLFNVLFVDVVLLAIVLVGHLDLFGLTEATRFLAMVQEIPRERTQERRNLVGKVAVLGEALQQHLLLEGGRCIVCKGAFERDHADAVPHGLVTAGHVGCVVGNDLNFGLKLELLGIVSALIQITCVHGVTATAEFLEDTCIQDVFAVGLLDHDPTDTVAGADQFGTGATALSAFAKQQRRRQFDGVVAAEHFFEEEFQNRFAVVAVADPEVELFAGVARQEHVAVDVEEVFAQFAVREHFTEQVVHLDDRRIVGVVVDVHRGRLFTQVVFGHAGSEHVGLQIVDAVLETEQVRDLVQVVQKVFLVKDFLALDQTGRLESGVFQGRDQFLGLLLFDVVHGLLARVVRVARLDTQIRGDFAELFDKVFREAFPKEHAGVDFAPTMVLKLEPHLGSDASTHELGVELLVARFGDVDVAAFDCSLDILGHVAVDQFVVGDHVVVFGVVGQRAHGHIASFHLFPGHDAAGLVEFVWTAGTELQPQLETGLVAVADVVEGPSDVDPVAIDGGPFLRNDVEKLFTAFEVFRQVDHFELAANLFDIFAVDFDQRCQAGLKFTDVAVHADDTENAGQKELVITVDGDRGFFAVVNDRPVQCFFDLQLRVVFADDARQDIRLHRLGLFTAVHQPRVPGVATVDDVRWFGVPESFKETGVVECPFEAWGKVRFVIGLGDKGEWKVDVKSGFEVVRVARLEHVGFFFEDKAHQVFGGAVVHDGANGVLVRGDQQHQIFGSVQALQRIRMVVQFDLDVYVAQDRYIGLRFLSDSVRVISVHDIGTIVLPKRFQSVLVNVELPQGLDHTDMGVIVPVSTTAC